MERNEEMKIQALIKAYYEEQKKQYYIRIGQSQYMLFALDKVEDKQVLTKMKLLQQRGCNSLKELIEKL